MKWIAFAPKLSSFRGHQYTYHCHLALAVAHLEMPFEVWMAKEHSFGELSSPFRPFFRSGYLREWMDFRRAFCEIKEEAFFSLEGFNLPEFVLFASAALLAFSKKGRAILLFRRALPELRFRGILHRFFLFFLRKKLGNRLILLTDSELIRRSFEGRASLHVVPIPHTRGKRTHSESLSFIWSGAPRLWKGQKEIERLLEFKSLHPVSFKLPREMGERLISHRVEWLSSELSEEEYAHHLASSTFALLPYDAKIYRSGTSGVFVEAVAMGLIPLVKEGSWLAFELERFGLSELKVNWEDPEFFAHAFELLHSASLRERLKAMQEVYVQLHSPQGLAMSLMERGIRR